MTEQRFHLTVDMDTVELREWLYTQSDDTIVATIAALTAQNALLQQENRELKEELERAKRCYESATGKAVCGEGAIYRLECKQMTELRELVERALKICEYFKEDKAEIHLCKRKECAYCGCHVMAYDNRHLIERCPALQAFQLKKDATAALLPRLEAAKKE